jgi:hypothetical protein
MGALAHLPPRPAQLRSAQRRGSIRASAVAARFGRPSGVTRPRGARAGVAYAAALAPYKLRWYEVR